MTFARFHAECIHLRNDRISDEDARRQESAAAELLRRFDRQPGAILADEVGMGKTFVALAAAVSVLMDQPDQGPVVVMCPPSLREKWPKDWDVFREKCLDSTLKERFRANSADSGIEFLRLLDDPEEKRNHIIFLTHGALNRSVGDPWAKLGVIKRAFKGRSSLAAQRFAFPRFAGKLLWLDYIDRKAPGILGDLIDRPYDTWLRTLHRSHPRLKELVTDDPVPAHLADALESMSGSELESVVQGLYSLPVRDSENIEERLKEAREGIADAMEQVWKVALQRADFRSPLLILDEAHHVKNPSTRLASLFATEESAKDSKYFESAGPLGGKFHRMLFLTATPFQLGHAELVRVLERFEGISWKGSRAPSMSLTDFKMELKELGQTLDDTQASALRLDRAWSRLESSHLADANGATRDVDDWWQSARESAGEGVVPQIVAQVTHTSEAMAKAEKRLSPWVLRYVKARHLPDLPHVERRSLHAGAAILDGGSPSSGIEISTSTLLPFLLAGRAQALLASSTKGRAFFAEGLSSSFEAYLETRSDRELLDEDADAGKSQGPPELDWYLKHVDRSLPRNDASVRSAHPKVRATAERAVALWKAGEKVLIFCHYRATGRALRQHISALLDEEIVRLAQVKLPGASRTDIERVFNKLSDRFDDDRRLGKLAANWIRGIVSVFPQLERHTTTVVDVVQRFVRTPSFLVRYLPLDPDEAEKSFVAAVESTTQGHESLRLQVEHFCRFLAERCIESERLDFLDALDKVQTGSHIGQDVRGVFDPSETRGGRQKAETVLLPNVRLANGEVRQETRMRLLRTFNTPLFPEILIASSVMAEGVDLHLNCRHVVHHDLCWNPSTLEQRSGRVDRIGCKAERDRKSILLYMPYVAATQDEKMYRVVRDRERWFQVIMGERYDVDEASTDRQASRVLLPAALAQELTMKLHP